MASPGDVPPAAYQRRRTLGRCRTDRTKDQRKRCDDYREIPESHRPIPELKGKGPMTTTTVIGRGGGRSPETVNGMTMALPLKSLPARLQLLGPSGCVGVDNLDV